MSLLKLIKVARLQFPSSGIRNKFFQQVNFVHVLLLTWSVIYLKFTQGFQRVFITDWQTFPQKIKILLEVLN